MNPIDWLQDNVFYTDTKTKEINEAAAKSARMRKIPSMMTPGQTYGDASYSQQQKTDAINKGVSDFFGVGKKSSTVVGPGGGNGFGLGSNNTRNTPGNPGNSGGYYGPGGAGSGSGQGQAQQSPGIGPFQGHGNPRPSQPTGEPAMGGDSTRTNANGVTQTGKQMSSSAAFVPEYANSSFNDLLSKVNNGQFSSNQLSSTASDPFSGTAPKTQSFNTEAESYTGNSLADLGGDGSAAFAQSRETTANDTFNPSAPTIEGGSNREENAKLARRRAFLDADDSMAGLRAVEKQNGVVYAGGQHHIAGEKPDSAAIGIDRSQARDISNGRSTAQGVLEAHIQKNKKNTTGTPAESQDPAVSFEQGSNSGLNVASSSGMDLTQGDFKLNNDEGTPFG